MDAIPVSEVFLLMALNRLSKPKVTRSISGLFAVVCLGCVSPWLATAHGQSAGAAEWTTDSFNPQRDAWQRNETKLTPDNVKNLQLLWKVKTDNKTMGMQSFREPLIISGVKTAKGVQTLAIVAGSSNDVFVDGRYQRCDGLAEASEMVVG